MCAAVTSCDGMQFSRRIYCHSNMKTFLLDSVRIITFCNSLILFDSVLIAALCNDDANGNVPLGKSCNRYWQCQGGYPRLQRCPAMLVFDRRSLRCVVPPTEDCDVPTTQPPPPEEVEQEGEQNIPNPPPRPNLPPGAVPLPVRNRPRN